MRAQPPGEKLLLEHRYDTKYVRVSMNFSVCVRERGGKREGKKGREIDTQTHMHRGRLLVEEDRYGSRWRCEHSVEFIKE